MKYRGKKKKKKKGGGEKGRCSLSCSQSDPGGRKKKRRKGEDRREEKKKEWRRKEEIRLSSFLIQVARRGGRKKGKLEKRSAPGRRKGKKGKKANTVRFPFASGGPERASCEEKKEGKKVERLVPKEKVARAIFTFVLGKTKGERRRCFTLPS